MPLPEPGPALLLKGFTYCWLVGNERTTYPIESLKGEIYIYIHIYVGGHGVPHSLIRY